MTPGEALDFHQGAVVTGVPLLVADSSKAQRQLGREPKITFLDLVKIMVDADMEVMGLKPIGDGRKAIADKLGYSSSDPFVTHPVAP